MSYTERGMEIHIDLNGPSLTDSTAVGTSATGVEAGDFRYLISQTDNKYTERSTCGCVSQCVSKGNKYSDSLSCRCVSTEDGYHSYSNSFTDIIPDDQELSKLVTSPDVLKFYSQNEDGDTDLHLGIIQNMTSLVLLLISAAPNSEWLNIVNLRRQTPLHLAVITKQKDIVRRLMIAGARVDICDIHGNTPLHIACREGYVDIVQCLLRPVYYEETLVNKYDIPYQRIPQDLTRRNSEGHTCLHLAALSTHLKVLELLVTKGADVNTGDGTSGRTILHYAAETGNRILLHFLMSQRRINISCRTFGGYTPLRVAAGRGYGDVVSILLDHGADVTDIEGDVIDDFCIDIWKAKTWFKHLHLRN